VSKQKTLRPKSAQPTEKVLARSDCQCFGDLFSAKGRESSFHSSNAVSVTASNHPLPVFQRILLFILDHKILVETVCVKAMTIQIVPAIMGFYCRLTDQ
jgi:hypothetical protein